jgi:hypothetical protein
MSARSGANVIEKVFWRWLWSRQRLLEAVELGEPVGMLTLSHPTEQD